MTFLKVSFFLFNFWNESSDWSTDNLSLIGHQFKSGRYNIHFADFDIH